MRKAIWIINAKLGALNRNDRYYELFQIYNEAF